MSKTRGNVIDSMNYDPQTLRMYLMFINHYFDGGKWKDDGYKGCERFKNRMINWLGDTNTNGLTDFKSVFNEFKNKIYNNFEMWKVNKVVSEWMIFYNSYKNFNLNKEQATMIMEFFDTCF